MSKYSTLEELEDELESSELDELVTELSLNPNDDEDDDSVDSDENEDSEEPLDDA